MNHDPFKAPDQCGEHEHVMAAAADCEARGLICRIHLIRREFHKTLLVSFCLPQTSR